MSDLRKETASIQSYLVISLGRCLSGSTPTLSIIHGKLLGQPANISCSGSSEVNRRTFLKGAGLQLLVKRISLAQWGKVDTLAPVVQSTQLILWRAYCWFVSLFFVVLRKRLSDASIGWDASQLAEEPLYATRDTNWVFYSDLLVSVKLLCPDSSPRCIWRRNRGRRHKCSARLCLIDNVALSLGHRVHPSSLPCSVIIEAKLNYRRAADLIRLHWPL